MTNKEAIKFAKENILAYTSEMAEFKALAIEALEKQTPKKPIDNIKREWFECPTCGRFIVTYHAGERHHCKCGQTLNWEGIK